MEQRLKTLSELDVRIQKFENGLSSILQTLQWDKQKLFEFQKKNLMTCKYDSNHRIPSEKLEIHENKCRLKSLGYDQDQIFLPEPLDPDSKTVVKLNREKITDIINKAANSERLFKRVVGYRLTIAAHSTILKLDLKTRSH